MLLEVFKAEVDWSSACISVKKTSYARYHKHYVCQVVYWLEIRLKTSLGFMDVIWKPLGSVLSTFVYLNLFWDLLEGFDGF